ncbi:FAD/NAD(P)-binding protein [Stackebrandtia nassauensis]|uniref:FAD dependent oxidoreductase n=1 Tax=Stackebrandtia nassauensis (strain DSM 44728 / CIP 108903 / NRRL B-16338 / NBRC 102104 / LLR-40K-21) TaxID=446470 RepID=D3PXC4_STANL|nr:FAD-dependent oxidoreductase [Stackebrandtia nassauensis]ADD41387.1 FAD dependent oxidoreductase [Stackebrandtia nassauensis DSM 44728]
MAANRTVVVIGGGFAGVVTARELLRDRRTRVVLAEPSPRVGRGVAYGASEPWHLLNSPAGAMSADSQHPGEFLDWLSDRGLPDGAGEFLPRGTYGDYLRDTWDATLKAAGDLVTVRSDTAVRLRPWDGGVEVGFASGVVEYADDVVLAVGNPKSSGPIRRGAPGYVANPWRLGAFDRLGADAPVLLVGTGLTAVDVMLSLSRRGHRAPVLAVSRHSLVPRSHRTRPAGPADAHAGELRFRAETLSGLLHQVREAARPDWRAVVDGMRGDLNTMWRGLSEGQQRGFLTHLARYWEVHRHRMAPKVAAEIAELTASGAWVVQADAIVSSRPLGSDGIEVSFASGVARRFATVVNCTGPARLPLGANDLVRRLIDEGHARPGPHRLGLDVDVEGRIVDGGGTVNDRVWTIGALRRGALWETTAVPEIREQAARLAVRLTGTVRPRVVL